MGLSPLQITMNEGADLISWVQLFQNKLSSSSTTELILWGVAGVVVLVYAIHLMHYLFWTAYYRLAKKQNGIHTPYKLHLRQLEQPGSDMLLGNETGNIFCDEYNLMTDVIFPLLDCAVMRFVGDKLPILSLQEKLHAKMHQEGLRERRKGSTTANGLTESVNDGGCRRWHWLYVIAQFILFRAGKQIGWTAALYAEATSDIWFYVPMVFPTTAGFMSNEYVFHALEEIEHGRLTTDYLRRGIHRLSPLICFPIAVVLFFAMLLTPPVVCLVAHPRLLFRPKTYKDLVFYYASFLLAFIMTLVGVFFYAVLPFRESHSLYIKKYQYFLNYCERRGIRYTVVQEEWYTAIGAVKATTIGGGI